MLDPQAHIHLLGPQRLRPTVRASLDECRIGQRLATITAGWEEREGEDNELRNHVDREVLDLRLWARLESIFAEDPKLVAAMHARYDRIRILRELYQRQLAHALASARELLADEPDGDEALWELARTGAIDAVRLLDARHAGHVAETHASFASEIQAHRHPAIARHRDELARVLDTCDALCIAGGHVAILLNRMRTLGVLEMWGDRPIFAWSAGAMVLTENIVLFHDRPPQGAGNAELLEKGFGRVEDLVVLPHASRRLSLDDPTRVALLARRFAPARCVALGDGARLARHEGAWTRLDEARSLETDGRVIEFEPGRAA